MFPFREYDTSKNGVSKEDMRKLMRRLAEDEAIIGKVPALSDS